MPKLYNYQAEGVQWLDNRRASLLADPPGLGKTPQALVASKAHDRAMIFCPASVKENWRREGEIWHPNRQYTTLYGRKAFRWPNPGEAIILNYELLPEELPSHMPQGMCVIMDEVHACKGGYTLRGRRARELTRSLDPSSKIIGLTGTPLLNKPEELFWVLETLRLVDESFGYRGEFEACFERVNGKWEAMSSARHHLQKVMLRRKREDVLPDMPDQRWQVLMVKPKISASIQKLMDEKAKRIEAYMAIQKNINPGVLPALFDLSRVRREMADIKSKYTMQICKDMGDEPMVHFSAHVDPAVSIGKLPGWTCVHGGVSGKKRDNNIQMFRDGSCNSISLTIGAGKEGINLQRAHNMAFTDLTWTPAYNEQAEGRIFRVKQENDCLYQIVVIDHPLDRRIAQLCHYKEDLANAVVN